MSIKSLTSVLSPLTLAAANANEGANLVVQTASLAILASGSTQATVTVAPNTGCLWLARSPATLTINAGVAAIVTISASPSCLCGTPFAADSRQNI